MLSIGGKKDTGPSLFWIFKPKRGKGKKSQISSNEEGIRR